MNMRHFSSDPIEKVFGKLRQGFGGVYFINAQQVLQKVTIRKVKNYVWTLVLTWMKSKLDLIINVVNVANC